MEGQPRDDPGEHNNKSDYYYNFKTQFKSQPNARFRLQVERTNLVNPIFYKKKYQSKLVLTLFFSKKSKGF
jgi:hypothetical protein